MALHARAGHCRLCACPDWDTDSVPAEERASLTDECETCDHKLGFHLDRFEFSQDEVRQRKARGEETVEFCKQSDCHCAIYQRSNTGECAVCGHKKGWHKAKIFSAAELSRPGSPSTSVGVPSRPNSPTWRAPLPPLPIPWSDAQGRSTLSAPKVLIPGARDQSLAAGIGPAMPHSPPLSPPMFVRHSLSPTDPNFRHRSNPPSLPLPPLPLNAPPMASPSTTNASLPSPRSVSGSVTASEVEAILAQSISTRSRAQDLIFAARSRAASVDRLSPTSPPGRMTAAILAARAQSPIAPSLLGYSGALINDDESISAETIETASIATGHRSSYALSHDGGEERPHSPPFSFDRTPAIEEGQMNPHGLRVSTFPTVSADPTAPAPRSTSLLRSGSNSSAPLTTASSCNSSTASVAGSSAASSVAVSPTDFSACEAPFNLATVQRRPTTAAMERAVTQPLPVASTSSASLPMLRRESEGLLRPCRTRETSAPPLLQPGASPSLGRSGTVTSTVSSSSSLNFDPGMYETNKKTVKLTMSPRLEGRVPPGTTFTCRVDFGDGVLSSDLKELHLLVTGTSAFEGDPMDRHLFLHHKVPILLEPASSAPKGALAKMAAGVSHGDQAFHLQWTLPSTQNCSCKAPHEALPLTPTLNGVYASVNYEFSLVANKRGGKIVKSSVDKFVRGFVVDGPTVPVPSVGPALAPAGALAVAYGQKGGWQTASLPKFVEVKNSNLSVLSSELAWQVDSRPKDGKVLVPYRITLSFGVPSCAVSAVDPLFIALQDQFEIFLARTITVRKAGPKGGRDHSRPTLRTKFSETRKEGTIGRDEYGRVNWSFEGLVETPWVEARSSSTCGVTIRYTLAAKVGSKSGLSTELNIQAKGLVLEIATVKPELLPAASEVGSANSAEGRPISIDSGLSYYASDAISFVGSPSLLSPLAPPAPHFGTPLTPIPSGSTMATTAADSLPDGSFQRTINAFPTPPQLSPAAGGSTPLARAPPSTVDGPAELELEETRAEPQIDFLSALFSSNRSITGGSIYSDRPPSHDWDNDHDAAQRVEAGPAPAFTMFPSTGEQVLEARGLRLVRRTELPSGGGRGRGANGPANTPLVNPGRA